MNTKLFKRFLGKNVNIIMANVKGAQVLGESTVVEGNVVITGFLLDEDEEFFYLGKTQEEIDEALKKSDVVRIFIDDDIPFLDEEDITGERH